LIEPDRTIILTDGRYETQIALECPGLVPVVRTPAQTMLQTVHEVLSGTSAKRIAIEASHLDLHSFRELAEKCSDHQWVETCGVVERLRMVKDAGEIETIRQSVRIAEQTFQSVIAKLRADWTEREIAHEIEATMRFLGADGVSFEPIVAAGPAGALPHYHPAARSLGEDATLLVDWGAFYQGYASDMTRTLHRQHASDRFRSAYQAVLDAQLAAIEAIRPGVDAAAVDAAARDVLAAAGLGDAFKHGLGHGIGLQIHESPRMSSISTETLESGMIITVEPGVYFEGDFGIRIEDDVLVTDLGHEVLSSLSKGLDDCRLML
jgi:Xaa-Pro aminopeptidase